MLNKCFKCGTDIKEFNHIGLNKKFLGRSIEKFFCINCLAEELSTDTATLENKIDEFIAQGCVLFCKKEQTRKQQLQELQTLPLFEKIKLTQKRLEEWYAQYDGQVYISFSGGKDSSVLLDIARKMYPDIPAVFADTGLEYPEIREFVQDTANGFYYAPQNNETIASIARQFEIPAAEILSHWRNSEHRNQTDNYRPTPRIWLPIKGSGNTVIVRPKMTFRRVIEKYGFPVISKEVARRVNYARKGGNWALMDMQGLNKDGSKSRFKERFIPYRYLLDAPFDISDQCCYVMKKDPLHRYERETGRKCIVGTLAEESALRQQSWMKNGCNSFATGKSQPLAFWTNQDILQYIYDFGIHIAPVYGDTLPPVEEHYRTQNKDTLQSIAQKFFVTVDSLIKNNKARLPSKAFLKKHPKFRPTGELYIQRNKYVTTQCERTGCVFCLFGINQDRTPNRIQRLATTHPQLYEYCLKDTEAGGLGMAKIMDFLGKPYASPAAEKAMAEYRKAKELAAEAKRKEAEEAVKIEAYFEDNAPDNCGETCPHASGNYPSCWRCCPHAKKYLEGGGNEKE